MAERLDNKNEDAKRRVEERAVGPSRLVYAIKGSWHAPRGGKREARSRGSEKIGHHWSHFS